MDGATATLLVHLYARLGQFDRAVLAALQNRKALGKSGCWEAMQSALGAEGEQAMAMFSRSASKSSESPPREGALRS